MAKTNIYDDRKTRYVDLQHPTVTSAKFTYFFKTNVDETEVAELGQTPVTALPTNLTAPAIAGTRRPTPLAVYNAKKRIRTLCSSSKFATAQAAGWRRIDQPDFATPRTQNQSPAATDRGQVWWAQAKGPRQFCASAPPSVQRQDRPVRESQPRPPGRRQQRNWKRHSGWSHTSHWCRR